MSAIPLEFAGNDYWDRTRPLIDGRVKPEGIDLQWAFHPPGMVFGRMARGEFQAGEMSAAFLVMLVDQGVDTLVGLPVITTRGFRHGEIIVRTDAGIETPADMRGKRIGCPDYPRTSTVWVRGLLQHEYGVRTSEAEWFQGDEDPGYNARVSYELPPEIHLTTVTGGTPADMLVRGELDAFIGAGLLKRLGNDPRFRVLLPNHQAMERDYYRNTGVFPFNHLATLRRDVYRSHPWMAERLMAAFDQAKTVGAKDLTEQAGLMLPWMSDFVDEVFGFFGGHPYKDGFEANYAACKQLCQYCFEQGLTKRVVDPEELFAPETLKLVF